MHRLFTKSVSVPNFLAPLMLLLAACSGSSASDLAETNEQANTSTSAQGSMAQPTAPASTAEQKEKQQSDPYFALPASAEQLAAELIEVEQAIIDDATSQAAMQTYWGPRQQILYRQLWAAQDWEDVVVAEMSAQDNSHLLVAFTNNWAARKESSALVKTEKASQALPAWTIQAPEDSEVLLAYYKEAEAATGIEWEYLAAVNLIETVVGRIDGVSTAGAVGPMQFLLTTWAECCEGDPTDTKDAIMGAAKYLVDRGGLESMDQALFGYNNSQYYVNSVSGYAAVMKSDERAFYGYHGWQVFFQTNIGLVHLDEGYAQAAELSAEAWTANNPDSIVKEIQTS